MSFRRQLLFWVVALLAVILALYVLGAILLPFVAGMAIAYMLDPIADRLQRLGFSRLAAALTILILFSVLLLVALLALVPVLSQQIVQLATRLPEYVERFDELTSEISAGILDSAWLRGILGVGGGEGPAADSLSEMAGGAAAWAANLLPSLISGGMAFVNFVALLVVTPVVAFYLLNDWDRLIARVDSWIPREHVETVRALARDIDYAVAGFVRGQALVCVILGVFYAAGLTVVGLNFGLLIGFGAGIISFVPYVGSLVGFFVSVSVAMVQFWPDWLMVAAVIAIFVTGQFVEGNFLQPNLVGRRVGLHPVWVIFALFAFGYMFGFVGLLLSVPLAAAAGVLARFALQKYLESPLYHGSDPEGGTGHP